MSMLRTRAHLFAPLAAALVLGSGAAAQDGAADRIARDRLVTLFSDLSPDEDVQIRTPLVFVEEGTFRSLGTDVVEVSMAGRTLPLPLGDIRSVSVRRGHGVKGALWGLGSGLLVGTFTGLVLSGFACEGPVACADSERRGAITFAIGLGVVGAATGYLFGRADRDWVPIFP